MRIESAVAGVVLFVAFASTACGDGAMSEPTATPAPSVTPGTPFSDLANAIISFQTSGVPTVEISSATFIGSVLNAGGIDLQAMKAETPSEEQRREGVTSSAVGESDGVGFAVFFYGTAQQAREGAEDIADGEYFVLCEEVLIVFDGEGERPELLSESVRSVMEAQYGSCEA